MMQKPFHHGWFMNLPPDEWHGPFGQGGSPWDGQFYVEMARTLERACFDYIMIEDKLMVSETYGGSAEAGLRGGVMALKHDLVPSCEFYPMEAVKTNIQRTELVLAAAHACGVHHVTCLSTDKAVYPVSAMGISKALMEKVAEAKARHWPRRFVRCARCRRGRERPCARQDGIIARRSSAFCGSSTGWKSWFALMRLEKPSDTVQTYWAFFQLRYRNNLSVAEWCGVLEVKIAGVEELAGGELGFKRGHRPGRWGRVPDFS